MLQIGHRRYVLLPDSFQFPFKATGLMMRAPNGGKLPDARGRSPKPEKQIECDTWKRVLIMVPTAILPCYGFKKL